MESVFKGKCIVDAETICCTTSKTAIVLVKTNIKYLLFLCRLHYYILYIIILVLRSYKYY